MNDPWVESLIVGLQSLLKPFHVSSPLNSARSIMWVYFRFVRQLPCIERSSSHFRELQLPRLLEFGNRRDMKSEFHWFNAEGILCVVL